MSRLELSFLGPLQIKLDGQPITSFEADKVRALLIYLAVESSHPHRREQLATLFWPGWPDASARTSLRNALSNLRSAIGDTAADTPFLLITRETIQFNKESGFFLDISELERFTHDHTATAEQLQSAVNRYRGSFLDGFALKDCPAFDDWSGIVREHLQQQASALLSRLAELHEQSKEYEKAIECTRKRLALEPWQEDAHRQLMRLLAASGQRPAALAQFEACKRSLKSELGVEPSAETVKLYESIREGEMAAPPTQKARLHNLPVQVTSFIGREKEIAEIKAILGRGDSQSHPKTPTRLLTLTGPGGTGKTRLALQVAAELLESFPDGVWLVELAPLADPDLVTQTAANALGMHLSAGPQTLSFLIDYLQPRRLLMIFDNCEHLIAACAFLADALLHACPNLSILVSSREALGIDGEATFRVPPLAFPKQDESLEKLYQYEAVRLFNERAGAALPGFEITTQNASAIIQVCQRLDGIPLAIELAAARLKMLSVEEIARRLDDRFRLLTGGSRAALPRYQTLRASIDWSYELLTEAERILLQRLSVFAGSWILEAAEFVGCGEGSESCEVLDLLGSLVNKSLVLVEAAEGIGTRYRMLETIRQYAQEKLVARGEAAQMRQRHLGYYLELSERVGSKVRGPEQPQLLDLLEAELDNLRLALGWSLESQGQPGWGLEAGLKIASDLRWFWHCRNRLVEGLLWLEKLLDAEEEGCSEQARSPERNKLRARAMQIASHFAGTNHEDVKHARLAEQSRNLFLDLGAEGRLGYAGALFELACLVSDFDKSRSKQMYEESLSIFQSEGDQLQMGDCYQVLGQIANANEEYESAKAYFEKMLACHERIGDRDGLMSAMYYLGKVAFLSGNDEHARILFEQSLDISAEIHNVFFSHPQELLGYLDWMDGNVAQATQKFEQIISVHLLTGYSYGISFGYNNLGWLALSQGNFRGAEKRFAEGLEFRRDKNVKGMTASHLHNLGYLAWAEGDVSLAITRYTEGLEICRENNDPSIKTTIQMGLGRAAIELGDLQQARAQFVEALANWQNIYPMWNRRFIFEALAILEAAYEKWEKAACLLGFTEAAHRRFRRLRAPREGELRQKAILDGRLALGEEAFAAAWKEGEAMDVKQAVEYARQHV